MSENTESNATRRRSIQVSNPKFQMSFLLFCFAVGMMTTITSIIGMHLVVNSLSENVSSVRNLDWNQIEELLTIETRKATILIVVIALINTIATIVVSLHFSYRISGIIYRLTNSLRQWNAGQSVTHITPRKGDFFIELVDAVNDIIKTPRKTDPKS